jgi:GNAT superfamily N-acetyltransferase
MTTRTARSVAQRARSSSHDSAPRHASGRQASAAKLRLCLARTGDHPLVHRMLMSIFHGPAAAEFQAQLDEPGYDPADRLIVKDGDQVAAHVRLARQTIQLGTNTLLAARFMDLATAQEYRGRGLATALLSAAERLAAERGILIGLTRTRVPALFARQGWTICGRHVFSTASPRLVLAELATAAQADLDSDRSPVLPGPTPEPISVRPLRRIELEAVIGLYEHGLLGKHGWPTRSRDYWDWLLARGACDRLYVAIVGPETTNIHQLVASIKGYAFVRQSRIVELITAPGHYAVSQALVARVCADVSEQDGWEVRCDLPFGHPIHGLYCRAGGQLVTSQQLAGEVFMARLFDPLTCLRQMSKEIARRAAAPGETLPRELGIELRSRVSRKSGEKAGLVERYRLQFGRGDVRIKTGGPSRHSISFSYFDLAPLLLGATGAAEMSEAGRLKGSSPKAHRLASLLFPGDLWFRPPLDDLLA